MEPRIRSQYDISASQPVQVSTYNGVCPTFNWSAPATIGTSLTGSRRSMIDYVVPRFRARQKAGEKFFNDMTKEEVTVSEGGSGIHFKYVAISCPPNTRVEQKIDGPLVSIITPRSSPNSHGHSLPLLVESLAAKEILAAQRRASTEVLAKIGTGSTEMWESVAQYRQTMELLTNPLRRVGDLSKRLLNSALRGNGSRQLLTEVSAGYLLFRYGILPAMKDIENILSSLTKEAGFKEQTSRAFERVDSHSSASGVYDSVGFYTNWLRQSDDVVSIRAMHLDKGYVSFANTLGFDFKGLVLLPVQLTSYSFVADWFFNLSSYIKATIPAFGWTPIGGCLVTTRVTSTSYTLQSTVDKQPTVTSLLKAPQGASSILRQSVTRQPLLPASFEIKSDFMFDKFTRVADAASLVAQRLVKVNTLVGPQPNHSAFQSRKAYKRWTDQPGVL